jgi:hypothetical protein
MFRGTLAWGPVLLGFSEGAVCKAEEAEQLLRQSKVNA